MWRSPSRSKAAARGATLGSMAPWAAAPVAGRSASRAAANARRSPGIAAGATRLACRGRESIAVSRWYARRPLARGGQELSAISYQR
jgi:hypothetical protein